MRTVNAKCGAIIPIGRLGENEATAVVFDVAEWITLFGAGTFTLLHQRSGDPAPYPCSIEHDGNTVTWTVTSADLGVQGYGKCELVYTVGGTVAKSVIYTTVTGAALTGGSEPPEPWEDWVDTVIAAGAAAQQSAENAAQSAEDADTSAQEARSAASEAAEETAELIREEMQGYVDDAEDAAERSESATVHTPYIGANNNWYVWDTATETYVDTGVSAKGRDNIVEQPTAPTDTNVLWRNSTDGKLYYYNGTEWAEIGSGGGGTSDHRQLTHRDADDQHPISAITGLQDALDDEAEARADADAGLQEQIDAITSQSDVVDVVGTYAELQAYDKPIYADDIVKVLSDSTHSDAIAYYRAGDDSPTYNWTYIGSQGPFYTKSEADNKFATKASVNDMATQTWVGQQGYQTAQQVSAAIAAAIGAAMEEEY